MDAKKLEPTMQSFDEMSRYVERIGELLKKYKGKPLVKAYLGQNITDKGLHLLFVN